MTKTMTKTSRLLAAFLVVLIMATMAVARPAHTVTFNDYYLSLQQKVVYDDRQVSDTSSDVQKTTDDSDKAVLNNIK